MLPGKSFGGPSFPPPCWAHGKLAVRQPLARNPVSHTKPKTADVKKNGGQSFTGGGRSTGASEWFGIERQPRDWRSAQ